MEQPRPNYDESLLPAALRDKTIYRRLAGDEEKRVLEQSFRVAIRSGRAWVMRAGQICRIITPEGPQVGDFNCWNAHNPRERFWAARTRQIQSAHVSNFDRLWSSLPYLRPMLTVIADTIDYGMDRSGGRCHDLLGSRCDPYLRKLLTGEDFDYHCHSNLVRAILPYGLTEFDVHDVLNIFQVTGLVDDRYFTAASPAQAGDYFEFFAEMDLLCAISTCPGGDLSVRRWGADRKDSLATCRPFDIEVYSVDEQLLTGWEPPSIAACSYRGQHGLQAAQFDAGNS